MNLVLDAGAIIAWLQKESGGATVSVRIDEALENGGLVYVHAINLCEVFYDYARAYDASAARAVLRDIGIVGVQTRTDLDAAICEDAAQLKADWRRVSLADCFGIALTRRLDADFLTTDRHELEKLEAASIARITFIR